MTAGQIMLVICALAFVIGTIGLVKDTRVKFRQRKMEKHYAAMREVEADNE